MTFGSVSSRKDDESVLITFVIGRAVILRIGIRMGKSEKEMCLAPTERKNGRRLHINRT